MVNLRDWQTEVASDLRRAGKSFLLDISFTGKPVPTEDLVDYISRIYGEDNLEEVDFPCSYIALVTLKNPELIEAVVSRFKCCTFPHITAGNDEGKKASCINFDVLTIIPMMGVIDLLVTDVMKLESILSKESPYNVLEKFLRIMQPNLGPSLVHTQWSGKMEGSLDIKIQYITTDMMKSWEMFSRKEKTIRLYDNDFKVVYIASSPVFDRGFVLPPIDIKGFTYQPW